MWLWQEYSFEHMYSFEIWNLIQLYDGFEFQLTNALIHTQTHTHVRSYVHENIYMLQFSIHIHNFDCDRIVASNVLISFNWDPVRLLLDVGTDSMRAFYAKLNRQQIFRWINAPFLYFIYIYILYVSGVCLCALCTQAMTKKMMAFDVPYTHRSSYNTSVHYVL